MDVLHFIDIMYHVDVYVMSYIIIGSGSMGVLSRKRENGCLFGNTYSHPFLNSRASSCIHVRFGVRTILLPILNLCSFVNQ